MTSLVLQMEIYILRPDSQAGVNQHFSIESIELLWCMPVEDLTPCIYIILYNSSRERLRYYTGNSMCCQIGRIIKKDVSYRTVLSC